MFVIGNPAEKLRYKHVGGGITPGHIRDMMSLIYNLGNASSHSFESSHPTELSDDEIQNYDNQIRNTGSDSRLLVFSIALQFCEILQWMNNYIKKHPDKEENRKKWVKLDGTENTLEDKDESIGFVEIHEGNYLGGKPISTSSAVVSTNKKLIEGVFFEGNIIEVKNQHGTFLNIQFILSQI